MLKVITKLSNCFRRVKGNILYYKYNLNSEFSILILVQYLFLQVYNHAVLKKEVNKNHIVNHDIFRT